MFNQLIAWQQQRRDARWNPGPEGPEPDPFGKHFDVWVDLLVAVARAGLGAVAALAVAGTGEVSGVFPTLVVGASAPAILSQMAQVRHLPGQSGLLAAPSLAPADDQVPTRTGSAAS
ncbi:hypothetical protein ACIF6L_34120 [Kitasatospora sp. NPDC086009]|uniref:hypothetical protein n=1 Tax=unclassified Kitasatospora TaxID=2633591 RepID=UPI0037CA970D